MTRILLIDNRDSFTWNIAALLRSEDDINLTVLSCRASSLEEEAAASDGIVLSPGPGHPSEAHASRCILDTFSTSKPFLGVCLGHQIIVDKFGGKIGRLDEPVHGKTSLISHDGRTIFKDIPFPFTQMRYHSLYALEPLPRCLTITARSEDGTVMGVRHAELPIEGVQFHPESVMSSHGASMIQSWLRSVRRQ